MAKIVGLSRSLKLPWLNQTVRLLSEDLTETEMKESLNEYLRFEIESPTVLRKTREILMSVWFYENDQSEKLRPMALELIQQYPEYALEIHWCMMLLAYPVFVDLCKLIGKMTEFQDEITLSQIKQKLFDEWGERTTLFHSIDKQMSTLKAFDVLSCDKPGKYHVTHHKVGKEEIASFMVYSMMNIDKNACYTLQEMNAITCFFPFEYNVEKEIVLQDDRFVASNIGGELVVTIPDAM